jgi:hypothetical protein
MLRSKIKIPLFDRFLPNSLNQLNLKDLKFTVYQNQQLLDEYDVGFKNWQKIMKYEIKNY